MADERTYILCKQLGVAARFYSRLGAAYGVAHTSIGDLMDLCAKECVMDDDFVVVRGDANFNRKPDNPSLFDFVDGPKPDAAPDWREEIINQQRKHIERLSGELVRLSKYCEKHGIAPMT